MTGTVGESVWSPYCQGFLIDLVRVQLPCNITPAPSAVQPKADVADVVVIRRWLTILLMVMFMTISGYLTDLQAGISQRVPL